MTRVLLINTYEQGHQPLGLAAPAAALRADGHEAATLDLAVETDERLESLAEWAGVVGISMPMHTAARLGLGVARRLRDGGHGGKVVLYGLGASSLGEVAAAEGIGVVISGDVDGQLVALARDAATGQALAPPSGAVFDRRARSAPDRSTLPPLDQYARYRDGRGELRLAGYVEATRGCAHVCAHCPLTPVYGGRLRLNGAEAVLGDIAQQAAAGAEHITFGDPDFLNAPGPALAILEAAQRAHPSLSYDVTIKVEHLLEQAELLPTLAERHVTVITSAFESVDDCLLELLGKGHSAADLDTALRLCADAGIVLRPTWLPFTPWTSAADYLSLLEFIATRGLIAHTPAVQLGLRLLAPADSPLVDPMREIGSLVDYDGDGLTWRWRHSDSRMDALQGEIAVLAEREADVAPQTLFAEIVRIAHQRLEAAEPAWVAQVGRDGGHEHVPGLTEAWFC